MRRWLTATVSRRCGISRDRSVQNVRAHGRRNDPNGSRLRRRPAPGPQGGIGAISRCKSESAGRAIDNPRSRRHLIRVDKSNRAPNAARSRPNEIANAPPAVAAGNADAAVRCAAVLTSRPLKTARDANSWHRLTLASRTLKTRARAIDPHPMKSKEASSRFGS